DIEFITGMTMVGEGVVGRQVDDQLSPAFGQITEEGGDLRSWGNAFPLERFPDNLLQVDNRLPRPKGERLLIRGHNVGCEHVVHSRQEQEEADEEREALPDVASLGMHSVSFRADVVCLSIAKTIIHL